MRALFIDAEPVEQEGRAGVKLWLKSSSLVELYDWGFRPYFYADTDSKKDAAAIGRLDVKGAKVIGVEKAERWVWGKHRELLKVYCTKPSEVPVISRAVRDGLGIGCYEFETPFKYRYMIDKGLWPMDWVHYEADGDELVSIERATGEPGSLRALAFDIEVHNPAGSTDPARDSVIMVSWADEKGAGVLSTKPNHGVSKVFSDEAALLTGFCDMLKQKDIELLLGYNSDLYDLPYMKERSRRLRIDFPVGRDGLTVRKRGGGLVVSKVGGRVHIDLYRVATFLDRIGAMNLPRYKLEDVYAELAGKPKRDIKKADIWKVWDKGDIADLAAYSRDDAECTWFIGKQWVPLEIALSRASGLPLFEAVRATTGSMVEQLLMRHAAGRSEITPNRPGFGEVTERAAETFVGAYVKTPPPGIYSNVAVFDFRSLYPSIIIAHNIDPATLNCDCCKKDGHVSPAGHRFCVKRQGVIPETLKELIDARAKLKAFMKKMDPKSTQWAIADNHQWALKIIANSFYGYLGFSRSRWYSREAAESVTAWGRQYIQQTIEKVEKAGYGVLYADTDSIFLLLGERKKEDAMALLTELNKGLPEVMMLELEGFYPRAVFVSKKAEEKGAKKKYAMIDEGGKIKIKGFELVRRDWAKIARKTQRRVLEAILKAGSAHKAVEIVRNVIADIKAGKVPLDDMVIYTQLRKEVYTAKGPHTAVVEKAAKRGVKIPVGAVIPYVITKKGKTISDKAELADWAKDYDPDYYIDHQVLPAVLKIMKELGYTETDLKVAGRQARLA